MNEQQQKMENIISLAKRRGFIYPGSDIYGGLSGTWDYGPLGVSLKRNIMQLWWKMFVDEREDMHGVDAAILMNQKVWQASGHVDTFTDPLCEDVITKKRYRTDHLLGDAGVDTQGMSLGDMDSHIKEIGLKSPDGNELSPSSHFNMMFSTIVGPKWGMAEVLDEGGYLTANVTSFDKENQSVMEFKLTQKDSIDGLMYFDKTAKSYLRPETAQGIFTNYKNVVDTFYPDLPFGLAQQGKAFRNEISPRDFIFRSREFEQMEIEYFVDPSKWEESFEHWRQQVWLWTQALGLPDDQVHELEVPEEDRAHYSKRTIDFEFDFPIGREELLGLAYRTDFDLMNIQNAAGRSMEYTVKGSNTKFVPHVIEPSFGVERALMAVLSAAYTEDEVNGEKRIFLRLPHHLAPVKFAISPLVRNKPELVERARDIYQRMKQAHGAVIWDDNGNIGKRYRRQDEIGTPCCVVVDFETIEGDGTVTVRDRDTTEQRRVSVDDLLSGKNI
ncbi:MAG TPA: glycine--tRNA ligase [Candidatus Saccharimonadaceae bacterium]|nr:glycine--tRNA ligase [Candidatus Saccharimonadaceae bacterium]